MYWKDTWLWAATLILCLTLYHFGRQRKLRDENTVSFFWMACLSLLVCALGIALTQMQRRRAAAWLIMAAATPLYLAQALLPWVVLRFISTRMLYDARRRRRVALVGLLPTLFNAALIVLNVRFDLISSISVEGLLCVESMFPLYVGIMLAGYLLDLCYVVQCGEALGLRNVNAAAEACVILSVGVFVQHYLHIQLFFGFAAALAMFVLHLTLKNPYAYIDIATHTFNARYFAVCMREALPRAAGDAIIAVELCQLERVERVYASGSGAELEACVAERLMQISPRVFRLAPGRFALWVRDAAEAETVSSALEALKGEEFYLGEDAVSCGASYVALPLADGWQSVEELSAFIDFLLRPASGQAETARVAYTPEARHAFDEMREVERYLEEAVCNDLFEVWYQPVCSLADERYVSLEALSRLHHPTLGWIPPDMFIRAAIHSGQMRRITPLQLERVCRFTQENGQIFEGICNIKFNLTPDELLDAEYCRSRLDIIRAHDLPFARFQFEITETVATQYACALEESVQALQSVGVGLCLDDFGSGYANLNTVLKLPFSVIKMDRSLLRDVCEDEAAASFYREMVGILKKLGYRIVAEGVETRREVELLSTWDVDMAQGFYFSEPLPPEQIIERVKNKSSLAQEAYARFDFDPEARQKATVDADCPFPISAEA